MKNKLKYGQTNLILIEIEGCFDFDASYSSARHSVWRQARGEIMGYRSIIDIPSIKRIACMLLFCLWICVLPIFCLFFAFLAKPSQNAKSTGVTALLRYLKKKVTNRVE